MVTDRIAKRLYEDWRSTDRELAVEWEDAPEQLRRVFLRYAQTSLGVTAGVWEMEPYAVEQELLSYLRED